MASIANASNAYVSAGNGNVYSLMQKAYIIPVNSNNGGQISILDGYINYDSQGNFTLYGYFYYNWPTPGYGYAYQAWQTDGIKLPDNIFGSYIKYPTLISATVNGIDYSKKLQVYANNVINCVDNIQLPTSPCNFVLQGQAQLLQHVL